MKFQSCALRSLILLSAMRSTTAFSPAALVGVGVSSRRGYASSNMPLLASKMDQSFITWSFDKPCTTMEWNDLVPASLTATTEKNYEESDLVIVGIYSPKKDEDAEEEADDKEETPTSLSGLAKEIDTSVGGVLAEVIEENAKTFKGGAKAGAMTPTIRVASAGGKSKRYVVIGLGPEGKTDETLGIKVGKSLASKVNSEKKVATCSFVIPKSVEADLLTGISSGMYSTLYSDNRYRTGDKIKKAAEDLASISIIADDELASDAAESIEAGKIAASGIFLTKDIVNSPHNVLNSVSLADTAKRIASESGGRIKCTILDKKECEKRGMGAYLGVARGSETEPQFIHLTYTPKTSKNNKRVGIVGKGLLFDTGGYNIKTGMMDLMKFDCGGSAAVLGAARAIGDLAPEGVEAHFIVAACENMINDKAMVPSDILTASNGKTIEVLNTDAEGRLTLADALVYADKELDCESIIELSTLTGACMVSLGKELCGVWTANDDLATELADISKATGDKSWRMPMEGSYNEQLESKIADLKNIGTRYGGAITAALFLQNFVDKKKPFAHIDIAGPVWSDKLGATGFGARMVMEWIKKQGAKSED